VGPVTGSFWRDRRVLVTGHTGFKGSWLSLWLARLGASTAGYSNGVPTEPALFEAASVAETLDNHVGDVRDLADLVRVFEDHRPEVVFHLAAQSLVRTSYAAPTTTFETNVLGTVNVLEAVRATGGVRSVIVVTTDKVYAHAGSHPHREDDPLGGSDPYSGSKAAAELATAAYRSSFFDGPGAPAVATVRAGNVIGGGDWARDRLVPDLVAALAAGREVEIRYPHATRPWQHVLNPLSGYLLLAERLWDEPELARAWNFGPVSAGSQSVESIVRRVSELWGSELVVRSPGEPQPPEAPALQLDASLARELLGWSERWEIAEGLRATVDWYRRWAAGEDARALTAGQIDAFAADRRPTPVPS
jgi:CDP-glucose 4,6-dehydratase